MVRFKVVSQINVLVKDLVSLHYWLSICEGLEIYVEPGEKSWYIPVLISKHEAVQQY